MNKSVAIVGASADRSKYGNKAVRAYKQKGWTVYPVNPHEETIEGLRVYRSVSDLPDGLDRVSVYLPPETGKSELAKVAEKSPGEVFFNPGAEDAELLERAEKLGLNVRAACSIVDIGLNPDKL